MKLWFGMTVMLGAGFSVSVLGQIDVSGEVGRPTEAQNAWQAWKAGNIEEAHRYATSLLKLPQLEPDARHLLFLTSFVMGEYEKALGHYEKIGEDYERRGELDEPVLDAYLHLGRYAEAERFARGRNMPDWRVQTLANRRANPLKVRLSEVSIIPYAEHPLSPYFPAFKSEINETQVIAHMDTGGTFLIMGPERAKRLGIKLVEAGEGYHGATKVPLSCGIAKRFQLGDAVLENVPVGALASLTGPQDFVIFGTNVLQQFLSTLDYPNQRLILSPRDKPEQHDRHLAMLPAERVRVPFYMWGDHYMFARGAVGEHKGLNFFIDSGLVALFPSGEGGLQQAAFSTSREKYVGWGFDEGKLGGPFVSHLPLALGSLSQSKLLLLPGKVGDRDFGGVRIDGLLSHAFLKQYAWTLDFAERDYVFSSKSD